MPYGLALLDKAAAFCGSRYKLAKTLEVSQGNLSEMVSGKRDVPLELTLKCAELLGVDVRDAWHEWDAERNGKKKRRQLSSSDQAGAAATSRTSGKTVAVPPLNKEPKAQAANDANLTDCTSWVLLAA